MKRLVDANSRNWDKATCRPTRGELLLLLLFKRISHVLIYWFKVHMGEIMRRIGHIYIGETSQELKWINGSSCSKVLELNIFLLPFNSGFNLS